MRNVLAIVKRDGLRLLRVPSAWVILFGLIFIPPLYAWFNVLGFWDPYSNTLNINIAVVNQDKGTDNELTGKVNLGNEIVSQLKENHQLGWQFMDVDEAMAQVKSSKSYAAIVIPEDFSKQLTAVVSDNSARPMLEYYVNEKANALATKVTDTGASTVDRQVNNAFVSTASKVISTAINTTGDKINQTSTNASQETIADITTVRGNLEKARSTIKDVDSQLGQIPGKTGQARQALGQVQNLQNNASQGLSSTSNLLGQTQGSLNEFISSSSTNMDQASTMLSQASGQANLSISQIAGGLTVANSEIGSAANRAQDANAKNAQLLKDLKALNLPGSQDAISQLEKQNADLGQSLTNLQKLNKSTGETVTKTASLADQLNGVTQGTLATGGATRKSLISGALPQLNQGLSTLSTSSGNLSSDISSQGTLIREAYTLLNQIDQTSNSTRKTLGSIENYLSGLDAKLSTISTDLNALGSSNALATYFGEGGKLDVTKVADFMLSPTVLDTKVVYPVASYGSGMAPLFVNLSLWVGAFTLMVIIKLEVDDEGLDNPTPGERYWGRWLLLAPVAAMQGLVTTVGAVLIGVQTASTPLFILTGMVASLVYLSITYALSTTFLHVGKALCIVIVILQIPGTSGLYPIEMMPSFFRRLYPFFPFTYSINALRETIGGFYGNDWGIDMIKLLMFALVFFALGLLGRPRLNNLNRLFAKEIAEGDMIVSEPVERLGNEFPLSQAIAALANKDEYRQTIVNRATRFANLYPKLKRGALIAGILVPAILAITFSYTSATMVNALAAWVIWVLIIIAFLMTIEMTRDRIIRQIRLGNLDDQTIHDMLPSYDSPRRQRKIQARENTTATAPDLEDTADIPLPPETTTTNAQGGEQA
ncbi:YhgE/Pip domain-containing protein [Bombiscardovia coagulans]|uniref:Phage infection protein-like protein n=1 Tax=Bombiscardovia coagulans TaxID=686666 RepID=A0A261EQU2_9BIFI|nr:YhgE/Pip domain-containing protein [Bombiscardovia coagulans]OZG49222.1 phage infection protein-like protein [Bombiscardovia coagulans]